MSNKNDHDIYIIPPNFIESGTFFGGMFRARNVIEAGILAFAIGVPVFMFVPFGLTTRIIILCLTALPAALVALIGISGESLSEFLIIFLKYLRNRRIVGGDGQQPNEQAPPMKRPGRHLKQRAPKEKESRPPKRRRSGESDFPAEFDEVRSYEIREKLRPKKKPKKELSSKKSKKKTNKRKEKARPPKRPAHIKEQPPAGLNPVADYLPIEKIQNGIIYTKDHRYVKVVEVVPINFMLRSAREQRNIIYSFVSYLKISPVKLQIKVLTRRADINRHLDTVRREMAQEKNEQCRLMQEDYLSFVQQIGAREAVTRRFFLIFEYELWNNTRRSEQEEEAIQSLQSAVHTASNYLRQCGNEVIIPENEDEFTVDVLYNLLCRNESAIKPLALRAQEVVAQYAAKGRESEIDHTGLSLQSSVAYTCIKPTQSMPTIISSSGQNNIDAIKRYFCSEYACMMVAQAAGVDYERMIAGEYKLLIEPIAYFTHNGQYYCMTATEAGLYDQLAGGSLRKTMTSLTHKNLPLSMFLEFSDLGISAWGGSTTGTQNNSDIINTLGVGIVWFDEIPPEGEIEAPDVEYRVDTDVITTVTLRTDTDLTPDNPASVTFSILGTSYRVNNIVIPAGDSQKVWVKWHTPSTPQTVTITVSVSGAYTAQDTFVAKIVDLNEHIPPDPVATDTNPSYTLPSLPSETQKLTANWGVWSCYWVPVWVWCDHGEDGGHWVDEGYWEYEYTGYSASISGVMSLMPDDIVPTASGKAMKSGYGVKQDVTATLSTDAPTSHITHPQTAFSVFPEFQYQTYLRLLQRVSSGRSAKFTFQPNDFSTYNRTVHFTPIWFPDSTNYTVFTQVWDTWTPDGMLSINLNDYVSINGSLYDDWYTNRE